jgi:hypothetical protein
MSTAGWIILILSVGTFSSLFVWCIWKVMTIPGESEHVHGFEVETPDVSKESNNP